MTEYSSWQPREELTYEEEKDRVINKYKHTIGNISSSSLKPVDRFEILNKMKEEIENKLRSKIYQDVK